MSTFFLFNATTSSKNFPVKVPTFQLPTLILRELASLLYLLVPLFPPSPTLGHDLKLVPSRFVIFDLEPLSLSFDFFELEHVVMNPTSAGIRHHHLHLYVDSKNLLDRVSSSKQVKKADDQEIENVKDEEGKNVEDQQVSEANDDTNNDDVGYMRQPIEDEAWFLAHEIDYPSDNEKKADHENNKSTQENEPEKNEDDDQSFAEDSYLFGDQYFLSKKILMDEDKLNLLRPDFVWEEFVSQTNEFIMLTKGQIFGKTSMVHMDDF
ncbi:hypothetical protein Tco_0580568 [Tanacetum coccineum]